MNASRLVRLFHHRVVVASLAAAAAAGLLAQPALAQHNTDLWVGEAGGAVAFSPQGLLPGTRYHPLLRTDLFHGWSYNNPGFDRATATFGGVGPLPQGSEIWLEVVELDPAFIIVADTVLELPHDSTFLGVYNDLHVHLTWFIEENSPGFDPGQCVWEARLRLFDEGAGLADSPDFTLLFTNAPVRGGEFPPQDIPASGDFDEDQDVDAADFAAFVGCLFGPEQRPAPSDSLITTCELDCHNAFDFDDDLDIDLFDLAEFQAALHFGG